MIFLKSISTYNVKKLGLKSLNFDFIVDSITYSGCRDTALNEIDKLKLKAVNINSTRRPEHKNVLPKDYYDRNKNQSIAKYLNKPRNYQTRFELYEKCFEILAVRQIKLNSFNLACDLGCGSMKHNMLIYKSLNEKYFRTSILWFGIDVSKFMLEFNNENLVLPDNLLEKGPDEFNYFEYILCDLKSISRFRQNISFDLCFSVSMLQWISHSRFFFIKLKIV